MLLILIIILIFIIASVLIIHNGTKDGGAVPIRDQTITFHEDGIDTFSSASVNSLIAYIVNCLVLFGSINQDKNIITFDCIQLFKGNQDSKTKIIDSSVLDNDVGDGIVGVPGSITCINYNISNAKTFNGITALQLGNINNTLKNPISQIADTDRIAEKCRLFVTLPYLCSTELLYAKFSSSELYCSPEFLMRFFKTDTKWDMINIPLLMSINYDQLRASRGDWFDPKENDNIRAVIDKWFTKPANNFVKSDNSKYQLLCPKLNIIMLMKEYATNINNKDFNQCSDFIRTRLNYLDNEYISFFMSTILYNELQKFNGKFLYYINCLYLVCEKIKTIVRPQDIQKELIIINKEIFATVHLCMAELASGGVVDAPPPDLITKPIFSRPVVIGANRVIVCADARNKLIKTAFIMNEYYERFINVTGRVRDVAMADPVVKFDENLRRKYITDILNISIVNYFKDQLSQSHMSNLLLYIINGVTFSNTTKLLYHMRFFQKIKDERGLQLLDDAINCIASIDDIIIHFHYSLYRHKRVMLFQTCAFGTESQIMLTDDKYLISEYKKTYNIYGVESVVKQDDVKIITTEKLIDVSIPAFQHEYIKPYFKEGTFAFDIISKCCEIYYLQR